MRMKYRNHFGLLAAVMFSVGLHNVDNAQNLIRFNLFLSEAGVQARLSEVTLFGMEFAQDPAYMLGVVMVASAFIIMMFLLFWEGEY